MKFLDFLCFKETSRRVMSTKKSLRVKVHQRLGSQSVESRKTRSLKVQKKLFSAPAFKKAHCVCFYVSLPSEVDTTGMIDKALELGKRVLVRGLTWKIKN